jgi:hypothetical protein
LNAKKQRAPAKIPAMNGTSRASTNAYRIERAGYAFELPRAEVARLKGLADFELKEEPALAEDFLRFRAEGWAENLADAGIAPGGVEVRIDVHERRAKLHREGALLFAAEI